MLAIASSLDWRSKFATLTGYGSISLTLRFEAKVHRDLISELLGTRGWKANPQKETSSESNEFEFVKISVKDAASSWRNLHVREALDLLADFPVALISIAAESTKTDLSARARWKYSGINNPARPEVRKNPPKIFIGERRAALKHFGLAEQSSALQPDNLTALRETGRGWGSRATEIWLLILGVFLTCLAAIFSQPVVAGLGNQINQLNLGDSKIVAPLSLWLAMMVIIIGAALTDWRIKRHSKRHSKITEGESDQSPSTVSIAILLLLALPIGISIRELFSTVFQSSNTVITTVALVVLPYTARALYRVSNIRRWITYASKLASGTLIIGLLLVIYRWPQWAFYSGLNLNPFESTEGFFDSAPWIIDYLGPLVVVMVAVAILILLSAAARPVAPLMVVLGFASLILVILTGGIDAHTKGEELALTGRAEFTTHGYPAAACLESTVTDGKGETSGFSPVWIISIRDGSTTYVGRAEGQSLENRGAHLVPSSEYRVHFLSPSEQSNANVSCLELAQRKTLGARN